MLAPGLQALQIFQHRQKQCRFVLHLRYGHAIAAQQIAQWPALKLDRQGGEIACRAGFFIADTQHLDKVFNVECADIGQALPFFLLHQTLHGFGQRFGLAALQGCGARQCGRGRRHINLDAVNLKHIPRPSRVCESSDSRERPVDERLLR